MLEADFRRIQEVTTDRLPVDVDVEWKGNTIVDSRLLPSASVRVFLGSPMPRLREDFPLILGDAVGNYRAALDHLTWALVKQFRVRPTVDKARLIQFPMHNSARDFEEKKATRTPGVPDAPHRAIMKRYQPYRRGDWPQGIRWIRTLANVDKHRAVPVTVLAPEGIKAEYSVSLGFMIVSPVRQLITRPVALNPGTPVAEFAIASNTSVRQCKVDVKGEMSIRPVIRNRIDVLGVVNLISATVKGILEEFDRLS